MELAKLFEMQRKLDDHIMDEHPELKGQNNLDWKILALLVELGTAYTSFYRLALK